MSRSGLLYFSIVVILASGAFNLFDHVRSAPKVLPDPDFLQHRWVIIEVRDLEEESDLTAEYGATLWQFLHGGHFVQFKNDILEHTGEWVLKDGMLKLSVDNDQSEELYFTKRIRKNELMLKSDKLEVRLLKLSD